LARTKKAIDLDWKLIEAFVKTGHRQNEIAPALGIDRTTLCRQCQKKHGVNWSTYASQTLSKGHQFLAVAQYQKAMSGNVTMLIHLGKVLLGQKEPESVMQEAVNQKLIDLEHELMRLKHENYQIKRELDASRKNQLDSDNSFDKQTQESPEKSPTNFDETFGSFDGFD
jgi:hypothetical protein